MSKKIAVVGIGNTLRRDDGIGIEVLESLLKIYKREGIDYLSLKTASFDLIHRLPRYDIILLIDGIEAGLAPGELKVSELKNIKYNLANSLTSTHEFNLKSIFELVKKLGLKTKIYVAGIQIEDASYGEGLSNTLKRKKADIVKKISNFIDRSLNPLRKNPRALDRG